MRSLRFDKLGKRLGPPQAPPQGVKAREAIAFYVYPSRSARAKKAPLRGGFF